MKKKIFSILVGITMTFFAFSQATLPTSSGFDGGELPSVGWTSNCDYYAASGNPAPALRLNSTGKYLTIHVASAPGVMTYDISGNTGSGAPWNGTFDVQESVDGASYSNVLTYTNANMPNGSYTSQAVTLSPESRYIRFYFTDKASGSNVGLDNVEINAAATIEQQMEVAINGEAITNNSSHTTAAAVGVPEVLPFDVYNNGAEGTLEIASIVISGNDAADFALDSDPEFPLNVLAEGVENIGIAFAPSSAGTKNATFTITSNDIDFPTFKFNVTGYGDFSATEPSAQPTNLTFSDVKTYRIKGSYTAAPNTDGYLILRKTGAEVTEVPTDGVVYGPGDVIGEAKVLRASQLTNFVPNEIVAGTEYHFAIFSYNGIGEGINYLTENPLKGSQTTLSDMIPAEDYANINEGAPSFIEDLHGVISPHYQQFYSDYASKLVENFYARDTVNGMRVLTCQYTGNLYQYEYPFSFGGTGMSREHTYASSWFPVSDNEANFYTDYHNLLLLHQNDANAIRSNYPLGEVVSEVIQEVGGSKMGKDEAGNWVYEPTDETKGAAARAMFYMSVRYTENGINWKLPSYISSSIPYGQDQNVLKRWNEEFPPNALEIARNDYIDSLQNNRNPFIDHPEYACFIDFSDMTHIEGGCDLAVDQEFLNNITVFPNPAKEVVYVSAKGDNISSIVVVDLMGRVIDTYSVQNTSTEVNVEFLPSGTYFLNVNTSKGNLVKKIIVQ